jgi:hypothetical protein
MGRWERKMRWEREEKRQKRYSDEEEEEEEEDEEEEEEEYRMAPGAKDDPPGACGVDAMDSSRFEWVLGLRGSTM